MVFAKLESTRTYGHGISRISPQPDTSKEASETMADLIKDAG